MSVVARVVLALRVVGRSCHSCWRRASCPGTVARVTTTVPRRPGAAVQVVLNEEKVTQAWLGCSLRAFFDLSRTAGRRAGPQGAGAVTDELVRYSLRLRLLCSAASRPRSLHFI